MATREMLILRSVKAIERIKRHLPELRTRRLPGVDSEANSVADLESIADAMDKKYQTNQKE